MTSFNILINFICTIGRTKLTLILIINEEHRLENLEPEPEPILKTTSLSLNLSPEPEPRA
jgi:hypothetical protein